MSAWELFAEAVPVVLPLVVALGFMSRSPPRWQLRRIRAAQEYLAAQLGSEPQCAVTRPKPPSRFEVLTKLMDPVQVAWLKVLGGMAFGGLLYVFVTQWPRGLWPR